MNKFLSLILLIALFSSCAKLEKYKPVATDNPKQYLLRVWTKNFDPKYETGNLPIATTSPMIHQGILFQGGLTGKFSAFDAVSGREIWGVQEKEAVSSQASIYGKYVIYGTASGRLTARHFVSGELKYQVDLGSAIESQPVFARGRGFVHLRNHQIISFDAATGKVLWGFKRTIPFSTTIQRVSKPLIQNNRVIVGFADGHLVAISLEDGLMIWERKMSNATKFIDVDAAPILFNGFLYSGSLNGRLSQIDPTTGKLLQTFPYTISRAPYVYKNFLYLSTVDGKVVRLDAEGEVKASTVLQEKFPVTGVVAWKGDLVVINAQGFLYRLDLEDLKILESQWMGSVASAFYGDIAKSDDTLAVFSSRSRLYVFR